jgi:hypothetical protein
MGKKQVTILDSVVEEVASIALFIEGKGLSQTAKKFVDEAFEFFGQLSNEEITHRPCKYLPWQTLNLRCVNFRKKYAVAYLANSEEIIICDFVAQKLVK